jgi:hypothetical protein
MVCVCVCKVKGKVKGCCFVPPLQRMDKNNQHTTLILIIASILAILTVAYTQSPQSSIIPTGSLLVDLYHQHPFVSSVALLCLVLLVLSRRLLLALYCLCFVFYFVYLYL